MEIMDVYGALATTTLKAQFWSELQSTYRPTSEAGRWLTRIAYIAYGKDVPKLDTLIGYGNPVNFMHHLSMNLSTLLELGIAPSIGFNIPAVKATETNTSPLSIATAFRKYGRDAEADEADILRKVVFLKRHYKNTGPLFAQGYGSLIFKPEEVGFRPFTSEELRDDSGDYICVGSTYSSTWFPTEYIRHHTKSTAPRTVHHALVAAYNRYGSHKEYIEYLAAQVLRTHDGKGKYLNLVPYLRCVPPDVARRFVAAQSGVSRILGVVREDATTDEMSTGLRVLFGTLNSNTMSLLGSLGRPLTLEDVQGMRGTKLLDILHQLPFEHIEELVTMHRDEIATRLFSERNYVKVSECSIPHPKRKKASPTISVYEKVEEERTLLQGIVGRYMESRAWRDSFLSLASPHVLLLSLLRWGPTKDTDDFSLHALDNVLRSHPNISEVQGALRVAPPHLLIRP